MAMSSFNIQKSGESSPTRVIALIARCVLGGYLISMGLVKVLDPVDFLKLLREYQFLSTPWALNGVAALLPWFEIFCGLLLITGIAARGTLAIVAGMFLFFSAAILHRALALQSELQVSFCALSFDCGCGAGEVYVCTKLLENALWFAVALWLAVSKHTSGKWFPWR